MVYFVFFIFYSLLFSTSINTSNGAFAEEVSEAISVKRMEKTTHLHFYFHDILSGKNPSAVKIVGQKNNPAFGDMFMIDDALTEGPEANSKVIGRAQGMYAIAARRDIALLMVISYEFIEGKYNGSSISILGRNHVMSDVREMGIVGGSGLFRFARGYAMAHTMSFDPETGDACVEYNVYVQHF